MRRRGCAETQRVVDYTRLDALRRKTLLGAFNQILPGKEMNHEITRNNTKKNFLFVLFRVISWLRVFRRS